MESVIINIKTNPKVKKQAQKVAADLGLSLSGVINSFLKQLIRSKTLLLTMDESHPSKYLLESIRESEAEIKRGDIYSFKNNKEALAFLDKF